MSHRVAFRLLCAGGAAALIGWPMHLIAQNCPQTSGPTTWAGTNLDTDTTKLGVTFDTTNNRLQLEGSAGGWQRTPLALIDQVRYAATGDFDRDGWVDFVGSSYATGFLRIYRNYTSTQAAPNWAGGGLRTPDFRSVRELAGPIVQARHRPVAVGDFNGDGWPDVFRAVAASNSTPVEAMIWLNAGANDGAGDPTFGAGYAGLDPGSPPSTMGEQTWNGSSLYVVDWNGDRKLDLLIGSGVNNGTIRIFLNMCTAVASPPPAPALIPCANAPTFRWFFDMVSNIGLGSTLTGRQPMFAFIDIDADSRKDLIVGGPNCCSAVADRLRIWKGIDGGGIEATPSLHPGFAGGATVLAVGDFSQDGRPDLLLGGEGEAGSYDPATVGGGTYYFANEGGSSPFPSSPTLPTSRGAPLNDVDLLLAMDYDHDPQGTLDFLVSDADVAGAAYAVANRPAAGYVDCGEAASGLVPLGTLATAEMVVTAARLDPTFAANGGTVQFFMSNEEPANWVPASDCGDGTGDLCATFPKSSGREVRWKAVLCSDSGHTSTPTVTSVETRFDYTLAREHYRAGVVINDGVAYVGAFRQPGDRGHFYAINAALDQTYWDVGQKLDDRTTPRRIFTVGLDGQTKVLVDTTPPVAPSPELIEALAASDETQAAAVVDWLLGTRFGVGNAGIEQTRLGAVETSTPAVLTKPGLPTWYTFASAADRARAEAFVSGNTNRVPLVLFGSKDGMVHAIHTRPTGDMLNDPSGQEAWAFIPRQVASTLVADYTASMGTTTHITAYPDGSPTLADYRRSDGNFGTIAIVTSGNGGQSLTALDVTSSVLVNDADSLTPPGPTPLWTATPGLAEAGRAISKPAVARVLLGGTEHFIVVAATGPAPENPAPPWEKGRVVAAYDIANGRLLWKFQAACPVTSDVTVFETDDENEPGSPILNGYIDRAVFADRCGNVYKVDPARDLNGAYNNNSGLGGILANTVGGVTQWALFSTATSSGALGAQSPIAGTLAARPDSTLRMLLFFGTGGLESHPVSERNEFYGVYVDTGQIRSKISGDCVNGVCEKFYGGVVVTPDQVILTKTLDPQIGTSTCDPGRTIVQSVGLEPNGTGDFIDDFNVTINSSVMGALYGDAGAVYFATLGGDVSRIGTPRAANAGGDTAAGSSIPTTGPGGAGDRGGLGTTDPMILMGWRQIL